MEAKSIIIKISKYTAIILISLAVLGLLFRATLYWKIPIEPGEPAGFSDVIEMLIYFSIIGVSGLLLALSAIVALFKNYSVAAMAFLVAVFTPVLYYFLHSFVPRLM